MIIDPWLLTFVSVIRKKCFNKDDKQLVPSEDSDEKKPENDNDEEENNKNELKQNGDSKSV